MHRLLKRQLKWVYGKELDLSTNMLVDQKLIDYISDTYTEHDKEQRHFEHTIDLNSQELNESNASLRKVLGLLSEAQRLSRTGSWHMNLLTHQLEWSQALYHIIEQVDLTPQVNPEYYNSLIHHDDLAKADIELKKTLEQQYYDDFYRLDFGHGKIKFVHEHREVVHDSKGVACSIQSVIQDVTDQKNSEYELNLYANVFRNSGESIMIFNRQKHIIAVNQTFVRNTGYTLKEIHKGKVDILTSGDITKRNFLEINAEMVKEGFWQGELSIQYKSGEIYPIWISITVIYDENDKINNFIASFSDISERKESEERIHYLAHHDALTGLINRLSFEEMVRQALYSARRDGSLLAILFIDMDRFKMINDNYGHQAGDQMLKEVARRLQASIRDSDIVGRLGGDEFVVCLTGLRKDIDTMPAVHLISHSLGQPYLINDTELNSSPSIGISIYPNNGDDYETLIINADSAMYHAKELGRNNHQFFSESLNAEASQRLEIENALSKAIRNNDFTLVYQPQISADDFTVCGMEALLRWTDPKLGSIPPGQFIPIAEETNLIIPLGKWVLEEACRQNHEWKQRYPDLPGVSVNISTQQLRSAELVGVIQSLIVKFNMQPGDLEIEVTESSMMENPAESIKRLQELRSMGVDLAIDDFGTGYSSLAYLKLLPIQTLKLDRTFVSDLEVNNDDAKICSATLALAHNLGLCVIAEGVETSAQQDFLISHHCEKLQGFFYSKPLAADELIPFIQHAEKSRMKNSTA